jgi:hypothetical protein
MPRTLVRTAFAGVVLLAVVLGLLPIVAASGSAPQTVDPLGKIDPWVLKTTEDGATTSFLVMLTRQADTSGAAAFATKAERGQYVYEQLTRAAAESQGPLKAFLDERQVAYRSYWIVNVLSVARGDRALALELAARPDVARIGANPEVKVDLPTPEEMAANEAAVREAIEAIEWGIQNTNAPGVWAMGYDGTGAVVAGGDTGYRWTHVQLRPKYRGWNGSTADHNYNWWDAIHSGGGSCGPNSQQPCDDNGHGTHTMGTMVGGDGAGPDTNDIGMAYNAKWIGCRNMNQGVGTPTTYIECNQFFLAPTDLNGQNPNPALAPHVINNSWGCPVSEGCIDETPALRISIENLVAAGVVFVASAGNSGDSCSSVNDPPAIYAASFSVAAHSSSNGLAGFSSRGPVTFDGSNRRKPDISGPGVSVRSAYGSGDTAYATLQGTSMAGPHIGGAIALLLDARPQLIGQVQQIINVLEQTANPSLTVTGSTSCGGIPYTTIPNNHFGYGRVDILAAVNSVPQQTPTPTVTGTLPTPTPTRTATRTPTASNTPTATACVPGQTDYVFAAATATIIAGVTDVGNHCDDCVTTVSLPFPVMLYDQSFSTSISVSSNGPLQFSSAISPFTNACLPNASHNNTIFGYWDDLRTDGGGQGIFTTVVGSAPNRTFVVEWRAGYFSGGGTANFEVLLHENSPNFETIYGTVTQGNASATTGVQRDTGSRFTQYACNGSGGAITSGLRLNWTLAACGTPGPTATNTPPGPTATNTPPGPTATNTPIGPTATATSVCPPPSWTAGPTTTTGRYAFQAALAGDGNLYVAGGQTANNTPVALVERYNQGTNTWTTMAPLPVALGQVSVGAQANKLYVAGGWPGGSVVEDSLYIYDIPTNSWTAGPNMPGGKEAAAGVALAGKFYVIGGDDFNAALSSVYIYDIATNSWSTGTALPAARTNTYATAAGGMVYVFGGLDASLSNAIDTLLRYDPVANTWTDLGSAGTAGRGNYGGVSTYGTGQLLITAGASGTYVPSNLTRFFDIASGTFSPGPNLLTAHAGHAQGTLADGRVLVYSGLLTSSTANLTTELLSGPCVTPTPTATAPAATATNTPAPPATATNTPITPPATPTETPGGPTATATSTPSYGLYLPAIFLNAVSP